MACLSTYEICSNADEPSAAPYLELAVNRDAVNSVTRGLVGDTAFAVLPEISPRVTFVLALMAQMVSNPCRVPDLG